MPKASRPDPASAPAAMPRGPAADPLRALLADLGADEYVRFRYGKRLDAALRALDAHSGLDTAELERRLNAVLELVRAPKGGASASRPKSPRPPRADAERA